MSDFRYDESRIDHGSIVVEIGAHRGGETLKIYERHGCRIIAVEPSIGNFVHLAHKRPPTAELMRVAMYGMKGYTHFYEYEHDKGFEGEADSVFELEDKRVLRHYDVMTMGLRHVMKIHKLLKIDLLLLDCEGSEIMVLDELIIYDLPVRQICVEYHPQIYGRDMLKYAMELMKFKYKYTRGDGDKNVTYEKRE